MNLSRTHSSIHFIRSFAIWIVKTPRTKGKREILEREKNLRLMEDHSEQWLTPNINSSKKSSRRYSLTRWTSVRKKHSWKEENGPIAEFLGEV
jgi:hypothetical protein